MVHMLRNQEGTSFEAVIRVDTLAAHVPPDPDLVLKYYGEGVPAMYYAEHPMDRIVFKRKDGSHIIIPDLPQCAALWYKCSDNMNS